MLISHKVSRLNSNLCFVFCLSSSTFVPQPLKQATELSVPSQFVLQTCLPCVCCNIQVVVGKFEELSSGIDFPPEFLSVRERISESNEYSELKIVIFPSSPNNIDDCKLSILPNDLSE